MKTPKLILVAALAVSTAAFTGCKEDVISLDDAQNEAYVQAFVKTFGPPAEGHTYNMATRAKVVVKTSTTRDVLIVANVKGKDYKFAEYYGISGITPVEFDIPQGIEDVYVYTDGEKIPCKLGETVDIDNPRRNAVASRAEIPTTLSYELSEAWSVNGNILYDGRVIPEEHNYTSIKREWSNFKNSGWQFDNYFKEAKKYGVVFDEWSGFLGEGGRSFGIAYWKKPADKDYEIGIYKEESKVCMPIFRTDLSERTVSSSFAYTYEGRNVNRGKVIRIDFTNKTQKVRVSDWDKTNYYHTFYDHLYDDEGLHNVIKAHYEKQSVITDMFYNIIWDGVSYDEDGQGFPAVQILIKEEFLEGVPAYDLPAMPENDRQKKDFYSKWDDFVYRYVQDHTTPIQRVGLNELKILKEYFAFHGFGFATSHTYPTYIQKVSETDEVYDIHFAFGEELGYTGAFDACENCAFEITDDNLNWVFNTRTYIIKNTYYSDANGAPGRGENGEENYCLYIKTLDSNGNVESIQMSDDVPGFTQVRAKRTATHLDNGHEGLQGLALFDIDGDGDYSDLLITSGEGPAKMQTEEFEPYEWIVAGEDMGAIGDWDFNDIVMGISYTTTNMSQQTVTIRPLAAGGIYPIYFMYSPDEDGTLDDSVILGKEIHSWLGVSLGIYNTGAEFIESVKEVSPLKFKIDLNVSPAISLASVKNEHWTGSTMAGFYLMVDRKNKLAGNNWSKIGRHEFDPRAHDDDPDIVVVNTNAKNMAGNVPTMICVGGEWEWPTETTNIKSAYPAFSTWVGNPSTIWYGEDEVQAHNPGLVTKKND